MSADSYLLVEWRDTETAARGWLAVHNFVQNYAGGGIRMHPTVTADEVSRLALMMAYKYRASGSETTGGCKGGIAYDYRAPDARGVLKRYLIAMAPYLRAGVSLGGDLGVSYDDVLEILDEIGVGLPVTKRMKADPVIRAGIEAHEVAARAEFDGFRMYDMITGYGCAAALDEAWTSSGRSPGARVVIQGFGAVGASLATSLSQLGYRVVGIADANLLVENQDGLDVAALVSTRKPRGELDPDAFRPADQIRSNDEWLDIDCEVLVPAALEDVIHADNADKVRARLVVEAANIPTTPDADVILSERNIDVCPDFVTNLGGIRIYDAVVFGLVPPEPHAIVEDTVSLIRANVRSLFAAAREQRRPAREIAREFFAPGPSGTPDI